MRILKHERRSRKKSAPVVWILSAVILLLCILIAFIASAYYSQMRLNRFSKNIIFSDNYFLRNYDFGDGQSDGSADLPKTYTFYETKEIVSMLCPEHGFTMEWFMQYRPDGAITVTDIYGYYYNTMQITSGTHLRFGAFLFLDQIRETLGITVDKDSDKYSQSLLMDYLEKLVVFSMEWDPYSDFWADGYVIYREHGEIAEEYESEYFDDYTEYRKSIVDSVTNAASLLLSSSDYGTEYDFETVCRLYYDSVSRVVFNNPEVLSTGEILKHLYGDEYGDFNLKILDLEHVSQLPDYPNGCEAVSAVMLLKYSGYNVQKSDFIDNHLEKDKVDIWWGIRFGPDPKEKYAGDPASEKGGWGCFAPVIVNALNSYLDTEKHAAYNVSGATLDTLCKNFIDRGTPVAIWVTQDFTAVNEVYQWLDRSRENVYLYPKNQHCVVLIGYDKDNYFICDPLKEESVTSVPRENIERSFASMGSQAVVVLK